MSSKPIALAVFGQRRLELAEGMTPNSVGLVLSEVEGLLPFSGRTLNYGSRWRKRVVSTVQSEQKRQRGIRGRKGNADESGQWHQA